MQLIEAVEDASQGCLVAQLALQGRNLGDPLHGGNMYLHPFQALRPGWVDRTLHADMVGARTVI